MKSEARQELFYFIAWLPSDAREANPTVFHSADTPTSPGPWEADRVKGLRGRLVLAAAQPTCAYTAAGTGKAPERMEKHQTLGR